MATEVSKAGSKSKEVEGAKPDKEDELAGTEAPLIEHLVELRKRLIFSMIALAVAMIGCFIIAQPIYNILLEPFRRAVGSDVDIELIYTAPQEYFFTQLNVAIFGALFIGFPVIAVQIYKFVAPGLYKNERKAFLPYLVATPVFFLMGTALVYFVVMPMAMGFFLSMQTDEIKMVAKVSEYLGLIMTLILAFGVCFQLPVVLTLLARIGLVSVDMLRKGRRYAIVAMLALAAFITPPDPISQIGLAMPLLLLYEVAILSVRWVEKTRAAAEAAAGEEPSTP